MTVIANCPKCGNPPKIEPAADWPEMKWHIFCDCDPLMFLWSEREHDEAIKVWDAMIAEWVG